VQQEDDCFRDRRPPVVRRPIGSLNPAAAPLNRRAGLSRIRLHAKGCRLALQQQETWPHAARQSERVVRLVTAKKQPSRSADAMAGNLKYADSSNCVEFKFRTRIGRSTMA
jgi:hypothetical protein